MKKIHVDWSRLFWIDLTFGNTEVPMLGVVVKNISPVKFLVFLFFSVFLSLTTSRFG